MKFFTVSIIALLSSNTFPCVRAEMPTELNIAHLVSLELGKHSTAQEQGRRQLSFSCSEYQPAMERLMEARFDMGGFECDCAGQTISCHSRLEVCCGTECLTRQGEATFTREGDPVSESVCKTATQSVGVLQPGDTNCLSGNYCGSSVCSCQATWKGQYCQTCLLCFDVPWLANNTSLALPNCANIEGGDPLFSKHGDSCEDIDTPEEVFFLAEDLMEGEEGCYTRTRSAAVITTNSLFLGSLASMIVAVAGVFF